MPIPRLIHATCIALAAALLVSAADWAPTLAQSQPRSLDIVGHLIGGTVRAVAVDGGRIYAGVGHRLVILDAAQAEPTRLGETGLLPGEPVDILVAGNLAYVATTDDGALAVVDIRDPRQPRIVSTTPLEGEVGAVAVAGGYAYLAGWWSSPEAFTGVVWALDLRDPGSPIVAGRYTRPAMFLDPWAPDLAVAGTYAYASLGDVVVLDVAEPGQPREVATFGIEQADAAGIAVAGGRAFVPVATWDIDHALRVFDITSPEQPRQVASAPLSRIPMGVALMDARVYVGLSYLDTFGCGTGPDDFGRVQAFDVASPDAPIEAGLAILPSDAYAVAAAAPGRILVATGSTGLHIVDLGAAPIPEAKRLLPGALSGINGLASMGDHVFVAARDDYALTGSLYKHRLIAVDARDPTQPRPVGEIEIAREWDVPLIAENGVIYNLNPPEKALELIDARDPARMRRIALLPLGDYPTALAVDGGYAFVALRKEIVVVNAQAPAAPLEVTRFLAMGLPRALAVDGGLLFVRRDASGYGDQSELLAFDVRDPGRPRELSRLALFGREGIMGSIAAGAGLVVLDGTVVVDARDPARLRPWLRLVPVRNETPAAMIRDGRLYTLAGSCLRAFDLTGPGAPVEIAALGDPGTARWLSAQAAAGDRLYIASGSGGLLVAQLGAGSASPPAACAAAAWLPARDPVTVYLPLVVTRRR